MAPDVPSPSQLTAAKDKLKIQEDESRAISRRITDAQATLAQIIADSQRAIHALEEDKQRVEGDIEKTKAYLSPMRRLPDDILQLLFWFEFEDAPCCAWALAAVCARWRRIVMSMPRMWSKIRLVTTPFSSPDTIRLWLERSGSTVPLDIEIYLRVATSSSSGSKRAMTAYALPPLPPPVPWSPPTAALLLPAPSPPPFMQFPPPFQPGSGAPPTVETSETLDDAGPSSLVSHGQSSSPPDANAPLPLPDAGGSNFSAAAYVGDAVPQLQFNDSPIVHNRRLARKRALGRGSVTPGVHDARTSPASWGHIALFYLVEQMPRWKRFVFRFEKSFESIAALKTISGEAPILEEFEVSCGESLRNKDVNDWNWLPSMPAHGRPGFPALRSVTLNNVPFIPSSPIFSMPSSLNIGFQNLTTAVPSKSLKQLTLRALPSNPPHAYGGPPANSSNLNNTQMTLNRLIGLLGTHTWLNSLSLHFTASAIHPPILPLTSRVFTLPELTSLSVSGALTSLLNALKVPALTSLSLALERVPTPAIVNDQATPVIEETVSSLIMRSGTPAITTLCVSFLQTSVYYGDTGGPNAWLYFQHMPHVTTLKVSHGFLEPLLCALGVPGAPGALGMNGEEEISDDGMMPPLGPIGTMGVGVGVMAMANVGGTGTATWMLPELEHLELRSCISTQSHSPYSHGPAGYIADATVKKLVEVVGARNPPAGGAGAGNHQVPIPIAIAGGAGGGGPTSRLKKLHIHDCFAIGTDVHAWLRERVEEFSFTGPAMTNLRSRGSDYGDDY